MQKPTLTPATPKWQTGLSLLFVLASMALFVFSLLSDECFSLGNNVTWGPGWALLLLGWLGVFCGTYTWVANPMLLVAWCLIWLRSTRVVAVSAACIALLLALSFLLNEEIMANEAGTMARITGYGRGYWLWVASIGTSLIGCFMGTTLDQSTAKDVAAKPIVQRPSAFDEPPPV